jgi:hypothetical protein
LREASWGTLELATAPQVRMSIRAENPEVEEANIEMDQTWAMRKTGL